MKPAIILTLALAFLFAGCNERSQLGTAPNDSTQPSEANLETTSPLSVHEPNPRESGVDATDDQQIKLAVGDVAPGLEIDSWVKGDPFSLADMANEKIVVLEFWATWCAPCIKNIPHISELQRKYKDDVVFIGVTSESDRQKVATFVEQMGDAMDYAVAIDKDAQTSLSYLQPLGVPGIPHACIIDKKGKLAWNCGVTELDATLHHLVQGTFDVDKALAARRAAEPTGKLGDIAAELDITHWLKGDPVTLAELKGRKVAVIEFWATWCGPCLPCIPTLTELQNKYADEVVVIAVTGETDKEAVESFVDKLGDKVGFTVAMDEPTEDGSEQKERFGGLTWQRYCEAFGARGIPYAFVIDREGKIVWHCHTKDIVPVVDKVVTGEFDFQAEQAMKLAREEALMASAPQVQQLQSNLIEMTHSEDTDIAELRKTGEELIAACDAGFSMALLLAPVEALLDESAVTTDLELAVAMTKHMLNASSGDPMKRMMGLTFHAKALFASGRVDQAIEAQREAIEISRASATILENLPDWGAEVEKWEVDLRRYQEAVKK